MKAIVLLAALACAACSSSGVHRSYSVVVPAPVGWSSDYIDLDVSPTHRSVWRDDRSFVRSLPQPRDYFRPVVVQGRPGWRYEAPQRSRKGR